MYQKWVLLLTFVFLPTQATVSAQPVRIAVMDFRNSSDKTVRASGSEMAKWMADELKKTKKFEPIDQIKILVITNEAKRQNADYKFVQAQLRNLPADFVLYGSILTYTLRSLILGFPTGEPQVPEIILEFGIRIVNLSGNAAEQHLIVQGKAIGDPLQGFTSPPYETTDPDMDVTFRRASTQAMRDAAKKLAQ